MSFSELLLQWYAINKRELPWRNTNNPYFIWISEIILQQTKVSQGLPYYLKFIKTFPNVDMLASANEDKVLKLWQGLGYYSRARNIHFTAKHIKNNFNGIFPSNYDDILSLKGVGVYTAAAIASFSFGLPYAVVDGNVVRVLSRVFGIYINYESSAGKRRYNKLAQDLLSIKNPAENNQAIMEFGALQCTPKVPQCSRCPFNSICKAYITNSIDRLPMKLTKLNFKKRFLNYLVIQSNDKVVLGKRNIGIWKGLYEFPVIENIKNQSEKAIISSNKWKNLFKKSQPKIVSVSDVFIHKLSHQHIYAKFWIIQLNFFELDNYAFISQSKLNKIPVSRLIDKFLKEYNII